MAEKRPGRKPAFTGTGSDPVVEETGRRIQERVRKAYEEEAIQSRQSGGMVGEMLRGSRIKGYKRGGVVKKTGVYKLHKGERVVPATKVRRTSSKVRSRSRGQ